MKEMLYEVRTSYNISFIKLVTVLLRSESNFKGTATDPAAFNMFIMNVNC